ncbi:class I SAM-dependent methyltransferase [Natronoarchaeum sp. GCM10025703]|uniref:class I SAM-dependent methyltransferase n=1 Tax=unclassified Natronoarchaeum TaxID=2620183 RepID=UPI00361C0ED2
MNQTDKKSGWIVPDRLTDRWEVTEGKSQRKLPGVLADAGDIDLFLHDSEHSLTCMVFTYELAWEYLNTAGMLLSDDTYWNSAFTDVTDVRADTFGNMTEYGRYAIK